jgi:hypothetical protein
LLLFPSQFRVGQQATDANHLNNTKEHRRQKE